MSAEGGGDPEGGADVEGKTLRGRSSTRPRLSDERLQNQRCGLHEHEEAREPQENRREGGGTRRWRMSRASSSGELTWSPGEALLIPPRRSEQLGIILH